MIVETFTNKELINEVLQDWNEAINHLDTLAKDYDKNRRKFKFNKDRPFAKSYLVKSKRLNNWLFILDKAPSVSYKDTGSINICSLVYYYTSSGLRVIKVMPEGGLSVYNGHLFTRFNERLNLGLIEPLDIVKRFFSVNGYFISKVIPKGDREFTLSTCKEGLLLGELQEERTLLIHKTFINKDQLREEQKDIEQELIDNLQKEIIEARKEAHRQIITAKREAEENRTDLIMGAWLIGAVILFAACVGIGMVLFTHK